MSESAWESGWRDRLVARLHLLGFNRLIDFARARESSTLDDLISELEVIAAPVQLRWLMQAELTTTDDLNYFARSMVVRSFRKHCPNGYRHHQEVDRLYAIAQGVSSLRGKFDDAANAIIVRFRDASEIPDDWVPQSVHDPIIERIFDGISLDARRLFTGR